MPEQSPYPNESKEDYKERIKKLKPQVAKTPNRYNTNISFTIY